MYLPQSYPTSTLKNSVKTGSENQFWLRNFLPQSLSLVRFFLISFVGLCASTAYAQSNIGDVDDRTKAPGCYKSSGGWGVYTVKGGKSNSTDVHDPRCERKNLTPKIDTGLTLAFEATYRVDSADNTTIAQILNYDPNSGDKHKPVVFIIARDRGSEWGIYDQAKELGRVSKNSIFSIKVTSYSSGGSMFSDIYLNGTKESTKKHARVGKESQMRYGNYHHGDGTAVVRVKDVAFGHGNGSSTPPSNPPGTPSASNDYQCSAGATSSIAAQNKFAQVCGSFQRIDCDQRMLSGSSWWLCGSENIDNNSVWKTDVRIEAEDYHRAEDFDSINRGGEYRDNGVDIQSTSDTSGNYNIGWTRSGERLTYDIAVESAGNYTFELRTASPNDTGLISVLVNGDYRSTSRSINYTGDYHQYSTMSFSLGNLPVGFHSLDILIENGGFNFNWLRLKKTNGGSDPIVTPGPSQGSCTPYVSGSRQEVDLRGTNCVEFPFNLAPKTLQVWDSVANSSCNFRGTVSSSNGSGSVNITKNYQSSEVLSGTKIKFDASNGCKFVKIRAH